MKNHSVPRTAIVLDSREEAQGIQTLTLALLDEKMREIPFSFFPGQFVEVSVFGVGEAAISISSNPSEKGQFEISVKNVGNVTNALSNMKKGSFVGIRGPFGNSYPIEDAFGKNVILLGGGIGIAPMKSTLLSILQQRKNFKKIFLFYGAKCAEELCYQNEFEEWRKNGVEVLVTLDKTCATWKGSVGLITELMKKTKLPSGNSMVFCCGPPAMIKFSVEELLKKGFKEEDVYVSLERLMQCGTGKCGHCMIHEKYVCLDGPVFRYDKAKLFRS